MSDYRPVRGRDLRRLLRRQHVERIIPPLSVWAQIAVYVCWSAAIVIAILLAVGGIKYWVWRISEWVA